MSNSYSTWHSLLMSLACRPLSSNSMQTLASLLPANGTEPNQAHIHKNQYKPCKRLEKRSSSATTMGNSNKISSCASFTSVSKTAWTQCEITFPIWWDHHHYYFTAIFCTEYFKNALPYNVVLCLIIVTPQVWTSKSAFNEWNLGWNAKK